MSVDNQPARAFERGNGRLDTLLRGRQAGRAGVPGELQGSEA